jgi:hypothetical protein
MNGFILGTVLELASFSFQGLIGIYGREGTYTTL